MAPPADQEKDKVYLFQFSRARCAPSLSPYCLKLETWLRMENIDYENRDVGMAKSKRGQKPFIEYNGEQVADSTNIIDYLTEKMNKGQTEAALSPVDKAFAHAMDQMIEYNFVWQVSYFRSLDFVQSTFCKEAMGDSLPAMYKMIPVSVLAWQFKRMFAPKLEAQGVSRRPLEENVRLTIGNIKAFSAYLGDKQYMTGDKPTRYDATAFGIMSQIYFTVMKNDVVTFLANDPSVANVRAYFDRIKENFYPDWDKIVGDLAMNSEWRKK